jgi:hypothetical protein
VIFRKSFAGMNLYTVLLFLHSCCRWLVLGGLIYAIYRGLRGGPVFTKTDDRARHITATLAHVQLCIGYILYFNSPLVTYFRAHFHEANFEALFFGLIHISLMTISVVLISVGSSLAKRQEADKAKFLTMTTFYFLALLIIFIAIPWPFSPLAHRPLLRTF